MDVKFLTATDGAYGRKFTNAADVLKHWNAGKDFLVATLGVIGTYISKSDYVRYGNPDGHIMLRYNSNVDFIIVRHANPDMAYTGDDDNGNPQFTAYDENETFDPSEGERPDQDYMGTGMTRESAQQFLADELGGYADEYDI